MSEPNREVELLKALGELEHRIAAGRPPREAIDGAVSMHDVDRGELAEVYAEKAIETARARRIVYPEDE